MKLQLIVCFLLISFVINDDDVIDDVEVLKNRAWEGYETKVGAHYYAYSPYSVGYTMVTSFIKLPTKLNTNNGSRNAYISFGVLGLYGAIDMGIMNSGNGWCPYSYDGNKHEFKAYQDYFGPTGTKIVGIEIDVNSKRVATFSITFRDSELNVLKYFTKNFDVSHILVYENDKVKNRFYRFASLVPTGQDNQNDNTYMVGGQFTHLTIVRNSNGYDWGLALDDVDVAWKVSSKRIPFSYDTTTDIFDIIHNKDGKLPS